MQQTPPPGTHELFFRGDTAEFRLVLKNAVKGVAFLRTNLGSGKLHRGEIISSIESNTPKRGLDWCDLPMEKDSDHSFFISIALTEVGHFEAKCFFFPENQSEPEWINGENVHINVEPAEYCCANSVYCAFVRQFGATKTSESKDDTDFYLRNIAKLDEDGYTVIPPSGTFGDLINELDFIVNKLNCRVLHLLPINPVPTLYGRMGRYGSPYAALDYSSVDPGLAKFDKKNTPMQQFFELIDTVHMYNARICIDIAINHTGWAAKIHETHPEWLVRDENGQIVSPGAWGVTWGDLTELDYKKSDLWLFFADVFLEWCERGIDGFRCDAGYMIPLPAWEYIIAKVRNSYPDTLFILEGLGGDPQITKNLLDKANMNWAYSELFQNYSKSDITAYVKNSNTISRSDGIMIHYAETHDNSRLAAVSTVYAKMRTTLSALLSSCGTFGFTNGVEWFATEQIDVHEACGLNWGAENNQVEHIARLNAILAVHPAFFKDSELSFLDSTGTDPIFDKDVIAFKRTPFDTTESLIAICNLNTEEQTMIFWEKGNFDYGNNPTDLITGDQLSIEEKETQMSFLLEPGEVRLIAENDEYLRLITEYDNSYIHIPTPVTRQKAQAIVLDMITYLNQSVALHHHKRIGGELEKNDTCDAKIAKLADSLLEDPLTFTSILPRIIAETHCAPSSLKTLNPIPVTRWNCPEDIHRQVMLPPGHAVLFTASSRFRIRITIESEQKKCPEACACLNNDERPNSLYGHSQNAVDNIQYDSLQSNSGRHFILLPPFNVPDKHLILTLRISLFGDAGLRREKSDLLLLSEGDDSMELLMNNREIHNADSIFLATNGRGATCRIPVKWNEIHSKYDAFMSANINPRFPVDRWVMWSGCRLWIINQAHSQELTADTTRGFRILPDGRGCWEFHLPAGNGLFVDLTIFASMLQNQNTTLIEFFRHPAEDNTTDLPDDVSVRLIIRPDIENRSFHDTTKASGELERTWESVIFSDKNSFKFSPTDSKTLEISLELSDDTNAKSTSYFKVAPEWRHNLVRSSESERGLDDRTDLFSPGYFDVPLYGADGLILHGELNPDKENPRNPECPEIEMSSRTHFMEQDSFNSFPVLLTRAMEQFIVKRDDLKTVIAGYPWFLDWGRDTLICLRGLITAGLIEDVKDIILAFAKFEENGTLPNIIHGAEAGNRDTSDAPLWFFVACADFNNQFPLVNIMESMVPGKEKSLTHILEEIAENYIKGTPNGIKMDPESSLIFSPSHFTWMDTNYPAGTPREGYPVEIQALWFAAVSFLAEITDSKKWRKVAENIKFSFEKYFTRPGEGLSDCLHASSGTPASKAIQDDAVRPNQLLAITLGLVENKKISEDILKATESLLVPGAIRSLADKPVNIPICVKDSAGSLLNDPNHPFWGEYSGDEDTRRKPAYHNGTAWTWIFPSFAEAYFITFGDSGRKTAKAILSSSKTLFHDGCVGHIPEILDGNAPHKQRGCDAQAWGETELYRVWQLISQST